MRERVICGGNVCSPFEDDIRLKFHTLKYCPLQVFFQYWENKLVCLLKIEYYFKIIVIRKFKLTERIVDWGNDKFLDKSQFLDRLIIKDKFLVNFNFIVFLALQMKK